MITYYHDDKRIVIEGFKNKAIGMEIDYDDVDQKKVNVGVEDIVAALNEARL